ncbi:hypothetical protein J6590_059805 [Homalodisca vitripennis]|nr:hypothetical protein J6590_059805 [Homalodisca vitripennis]
MRRHIQRAIIFKNSSVTGNVSSANVNHTLPIQFLINLEGSSTDSIQSDPHVTFVICPDYTKILIFPAFRIPACLPTHYNSGQFCSVYARLVSGIDTCASP